MGDLNRIASRFGKKAHLTEGSPYTSDGPQETICGRQIVPHAPEGADLCAYCEDQLAARPTPPERGGASDA